MRELSTVRDRITNKSYILIFYMWERAGTDTEPVRLLSRALKRFSSLCALSLDKPPAYISRSLGSEILRDASTTIPTAGESTSGLLSADNTLNLSKAIIVNRRQR